MQRVIHLIQKDFFLEIAPNCIRKEPTMKAIKHHMIRILFILIIVLIPLIISNGKPSSAKTKSVTVVIGEDKGVYVSAYNTIKSGQIIISNSNVKATFYKKMGSVTIRPKKPGNSVVRVKYRLRSSKACRLMIKIKIISVKTLCKRAFKIQNKMRADKGVKALEWSDEAYEFGMYRLKKHGYDFHEHMIRDAKDYFGDYYWIAKLINSENLAAPSTYAPKYVMNLWKNSPGHYQNLLKETYQCGAIAKCGGIWIAVFFDKSASKIDGWREYTKGFAPITVKAYDIKSGIYIDEENFSYYEKDDKWDTILSTRIRNINGLKLYLEVGKTYVFLDKNIENSEDKVRMVELTVSDNTPQTVEFRL